MKTMEMCQVEVLLKTHNSHCDYTKNGLYYIDNENNSLYTMGNVR